MKTLLNLNFLPKMKKLKISTLLLSIALLSMSMGFPHQATEGDAKVSYSGFMSCTAHHTQVKQQEKPVIDPQVKKADNETNETCKKVSNSLVKGSAKIITNMLTK
jgi:hypothetical protein